MVPCLRVYLGWISVPVWPLMSSCSRTGILFSKPKVIAQLEQAEDFPMVESGMFQGVYLGKCQEAWDLNLALPGHIKGIMFGGLRLGASFDVPAHGVAGKGTFRGRGELSKHRLYFVKCLHVVI